MCILFKRTRVLLKRKRVLLKECTFFSKEIVLLKERNVLSGFISRNTFEKKCFSFFFTLKKNLKFFLQYIFIYIYLYIYIYIYIYLYLSKYQYIYIQLFLNISIYILKKRTRVGHAFFSKECKRTQVLLGFISCKKFEKST